MRRQLAPLLALPALLLLGADAGAGTPSTGAGDLTPIEITLIGPDAVRLRVAQGRTFPCDSGDNRQLVAGKFERGQVIRLSTPEHCVCFQQTYAPFPDVDWSASALVCRPQVCKRPGRKYCVPAPDPTIRVSIHSMRPG